MMWTPHRPAFRRRTRIVLLAFFVFWIVILLFPDFAEGRLPAPIRDPYCSDGDADEPYGRPMSLAAQVLLWMLRAGLAGHLLP